MQLQFTLFSIDNCFMTVKYFYTFEDKQFLQSNEYGCHIKKGIYICFKSDTWMRFVRFELYFL